MAHIRYLDMLELKRKSKHNRLPEIAKFTISGRLIALAADCAHLHFEIKDGCTRDVYAKKESWLAKYEITRETIDVYSCGVYNGMLDLDPSTPLDGVTQGLSKSLHKAATNAFLTQWPMPPNLVESYKIVGMMRNVVIKGDATQTNSGNLYHKKARVTVQQFMKKKKRLYLYFDFFLGSWFVFLPSKCECTIPYILLVFNTVNSKNTFTVFS